MSSGSLKSGPTAKPAIGPQTTPTNTNPLLEKVNARTSTPDSEALASSDDEGDHRLDASVPPAQHQNPVRRSSWLNDTSTSSFARPRKSSIASGSMSPTASNPSTPSAETGVTSAAASTWGSHAASSSISRAPPVAPTFPWGTGIWNTDRKDPPQRLSEVLPSPTSTVPSSNSFFGPDLGAVQTSPTLRDGASNSQIPFAIPLHPTPKTYRSQSYSVGQTDPEANLVIGSAPGPSSSSTSVATMHGGGRARHPGLQHRPSRPSMLSEMANDGSMLGKVKEVEDDEDDDESASESVQGSFHRSSESKMIEMLARENAILRQQQYARMRPRASTGGGPYFTSNGGGHSLQESVPEELDYAVDELDELNDAGGVDLYGGARVGGQGVAGRRMSEFGGPQFRSPFGGSSNSKADSNSNLKKALWSTPGVPINDASQSRRHSFANMPTRQGSISSIADSGPGPLDSTTPDGQHQMMPPGYPDPSTFGTSASSNASYIGAGGPPGGVFGGGNPFQQAPPPPFGVGVGGQFHHRPASPHRSLYTMGQPRHNQLLHIVLFKCARADVFYIQEGTGLTVKPGDLVIVEADRGTDLGTVAKGNVDWQTAKELKEHYAEEHYKWLMMYSQGAAAAQDGTTSGSGLLASSSSLLSNSSNGGGVGAGGLGLQGSAIGGMGPPPQQQQQHQHHGHLQEPNGAAAGELRPKLIKRLAQNHEVHSLRDKEGQEAKAKRVCMQKVKEHGLNMEILDAEFQMDWKKLTFYYFADAYINFNPLVTDLFKIYKTRIWMSAINPASFASPTLGIQAPSGVGPGAVGVGRSTNDGRQTQTQQQQQQQKQHQEQQQAQQHQQQAFGGGGGRAFRPSPTQHFVPDRSGGGYGGGVGVGIPAAAATGVPNYAYAQGGGAFGDARLHYGAVSPSLDGSGGFPGAIGMGMGMGIQQQQHQQQQQQQFGGFQQATSMRHHRFPTPQQSPHGQGMPGMVTPQGDWNAAAFQGLSLNSG
ncbi:Cell fate regulator YaaT, PSP1 superfamily [Geosmithia morbida]|uniref:Cell fate regulator YaaT, PSP1 superfamily n=1 Tax=Geosmithia morbida TaxID=1094350 RepID=A0A9P5D4J7_9HYPO|nr:Cell fate regulator YaaT, PSP1 superfamily [Geosmithia morbida]KAF4123616.1 Cell fate regulator YaaT, PSP1 superfamily [Geosmithia morbida]